MKRHFSSRFKRSPTRTVKLVCFECAGEYYGLDISKVEHILPDFKLHGCLDSGRSLVKYKGHAIAVLDLTQFFMNPQEAMATQGFRQSQYLIICTLNSHSKQENQLRGDRGDRFGIPIMEMPTILEVPETQLEDLPELYQHGPPGSQPAPKAIEKLIHTADDKTIFYLNLETLIHS